LFNNGFSHVPRVEETHLIQWPILFRVRTHTLYSPNTYTQMVSPAIINESWQALAEDINIFLGEILEVAKRALRTLHKEVNQACKTIF